MMQRMTTKVRKSFMALQVDGPIVEYPSTAQSVHKGQNNPPGASSIPKAGHVDTGRFDRGHSNRSITELVKMVTPRLTHTKAVGQSVARTV